MPSYNESLDESLGLLYDYSLKFRVSIELIQKLAQYLKLDTFIDTEVQPTSSSNLNDFKRLSIAGSLLLVDLDFDGDHNPIKVSLSSGNHAVGDSEISKQFMTDQSDELSKYIVLVDEKDLLSVVKIDFYQGGTSFLNVRHVEDRSVAEHILLSNFTLGTLGKFPANLRYLANLDSLSLPDGDLVVYMDNLAKYLNAVHGTEIKTNPGNWQIEAGWKSRLGKVTLNDIEGGRLGVMLLFWKENRHFDHKVESTGVEGLGKIHNAVLSIEESSQPSIDYVKDASKETWKLPNLAGEFKNYKFIFDGDLHLHNGQSVTSLTSRNWALELNLDTPVYLPSSLIDYLGLTGYKTAKDNELSHMFKRLSECGRLEYELDVQHVSISFSTEEINHYLAIQSIRLESLLQLSKLMPIIRNYLALTALIRNVSQVPGAVLQDIKSDFAEANKKLKDSLRLSSEVTDEELVGLSAMSEATDYMGVPILGGDTDLSDFVKQESQDDMVRGESDKSEISWNNAQNNLSFVVRDIAYDSPDSDIVLSVIVNVETKEFSSDLTIKNGEISEKTSTGDIDMDADSSISKDYNRALALSEDPLLAFEVII